MVIDLWKYLKPKKEEEEEKTDYLKNMEDRLGIPQYTDLVEETQKKVIDLSKYIIVKGEVKAGVGAKAEGGIKLETKKEEPNVFDTLNESIEKNYKQYQSMTKKLESYQAEYDYAPDNIKPSIAANFNKLVGQHDDLIKQLQSDIGKRDQMITTINKINFMKYKQLTGLPGEVGKATPLPGPKPIIEGLPISKPEDKPEESILNKVKDLAVNTFGTWSYKKKVNPELQKTEDYAMDILALNDDDKEIATIYQNLTGTPIVETLEGLKKKREEPLLKRIGPDESWGDYYKREGLLKTIISGPKGKYDEAINIHNQLKDIALKVSNPGADLISQIGWTGFAAIMGYQTIAGLIKITPEIWKKLSVKVENRTVPFEEGKKAVFDTAYGTGTPQQRIIFNEAIKSADIKKISVMDMIKEGVKITEFKPRFALGAKLYAGLPADEIVKAIVEIGKVTPEMIKGLDPLKLSQITETLFNYSPALAIQLMEARAKFAVPEVKAVEKPEVSLAKPQTKEELYAEKYNIPLEKVKITELPPGKKEPLTEGLEPELPEFKEEIEREPTAEELKIIDLERQIPENLKKPVPPELKADYLKIIGKEVKLARDKMKLAEDIRKDITPSPEILVKYPDLIKELSKPELTKIEISKVEIPESLKKPVPPELKNEYLKIIQKEVKPAIDKLKIIKDIKENKPISEGILGKYPELTEKLAKLSETKPLEIKVKPAEKLPEGQKPIPAGVENLPEGWIIKVGGYQTEGKKAKIDWRDKVLIFENEEARNNPEIFGHELAHILLGSLKPDIKKNMLDEYIKVGDISEWEVKNGYHNEKFAIDYTKYIFAPDSINLKLKLFFDKISNKPIGKLEQIEKVKPPVTEKPMVEPEEIEPEPTPEEIKATFMEEENLGTTVKNREYFLSKFGNLFTETKKIEDTLLKEKFNEMQSMIEYEEDDIFKLVSGKEKMRIPKTTKTEWMEGLGKGKYMQIFREDKNLQYPDEIASNLGISEDELREQIIERIRTAPEKVTLESAKQALIDERNSIFMQVNAQMDAYRILLDEIEGGEYSFDTPQNIKRLNAKINTIKDDNKKLMERYEKEITELQKEGIEKRYEELKKRTEAIKNIEIETGIKKGLKIAKAELKGRKLKGMTKEEIEEGNKLIQQIQIIAKDRGLTKKQFSDIKMIHGEARSLSGKTKRMTIPQLKAVLKAVESVRPKRIGYKPVITLKTENKIQSLKDNLINKLQMTEETYQEVLKSEGVYKEPKYIDAKNFITEKKGKDIIYRLIDEANILKITLPLKQAVDKNPSIKKEVDRLNQRIKSEGERGLKDPHELRSMRFYIQAMETITGAPLYTLYQDLIDVHLENKVKLGVLMKEFEGYKEIVKDENALKRINNYIASKSNLKDKPESPKDITPREIEMAKKIEGILEDYEARARTEVFLDNVDHPEDMPQYLQYKKEINKAKDIYESKGYDDLTEYLKTQEWGTIKSGYSPLQIIFSKVRIYKPKPQTFGKSHIKPRTDIEYKESDTNILQRLFSYKRQMDNLVSMRPKVRAFITLIDKNLDKFKNPRRVESVIEVFLRELKGYNKPENWFERGIDRLYAQAIQTILLANPSLSGRNLLQNIALEYDKSILIDPRNKSLTDNEINYFNTYILQTESMKMDWLMVGEKPLPGLATLTKIINKIGFYPYTDQATRHWGFWSKINQVKRGFDNNNNLSTQMKDAKFSDIELLEQKMALEILAKDGIEAMAKYVTRVHVEDTQFIYDRAQRSPAEMGGGKVFSNLMLFPRAYWELLLKEARKFTGKGIPFKERLRAFKVIANIIIGGILVDVAIKKVTGKKDSSYSPLDLLAYKTGGLALESLTLVNDIYVDIIQASRGDEKALAALTTSMPATADMFIPFYNYFLRALEASTDTKNIDKLALRKLRMLIDKEYEVRGGAYVLERNAMEKWQYFLAGAGVDVTIKEREKKEKEKGKFPMKVKVPKGSKSIKSKFPMKVKVPKK